MKLNLLPHRLSVCKVNALRPEDLAQPLCFTACTDEELSLVCPTERVPADSLASEDGWRAFRIEGVLDFSLVGILSPIAQLLAEARVGIFAVSTYNTDYVLVKEMQLPLAVEVLSAAGYDIG